MPKGPSQRVSPLSSSVYAVLAKRLEGYTGKRYPFHIGDNAVAPPQAAQWPAVDMNRLGNPYRYGHPAGESALLEALADKVRRHNGLDFATPDHVQVTVGATHGVAIALQALLDPGDEVLLLAPYWPLVRGAAWCGGVTPTDVPFFQALLDDPTADPKALIRPFIGPRTKMIYVITPSNPTGMVLSRDQLTAIGELAQEHDLWVFADEAYESYTYDPARPHISIASLPGMAERTITVWTFSKTYAMAGTRVGYLAGPPEAISACRKVATHSVYNVAQVTQSAALAALSAGDDFLSAARETYAGFARLVAERLKARFHPSQGGAYVFVDLRHHGEEPMRLLERAADRGVTLAPGVVFGADYQGYARFCYTAVDRESLIEGIDILNAVWA